ncbi:MAG TPA: hypothetical protein PLB49_11435 [Chitinophagaceae bacterium]|nr:hypothetical protein [Chitinophagaceae bacterium]
MKRVVILYWKGKTENPVEVFSNLKILCASYPVYNYNTLNNYLSKSKMHYENNNVRIERKLVQNTPVKTRQIVMLGNRINKNVHNEEQQNLDYWLSRPVSERLDAVTRLRAQLLKGNERMKKNIGHKRKLK